MRRLVLALGLVGCVPAAHPVAPHHVEARAGTSHAGASAEAADEIARTASHAKLPAPHRSPVAATIHAASDLRQLVGWRDKRPSITAILGWAAELGLHTEASTGAELVAWAERMHRLRDRTDTARPGDLLVFSHVEREDFDLVGIAIGRTGSVTEFICVAGGVVRRGFLDAARPKLRRDADGAIVNTRLRFGSRQPPTNTSQFAGELVVHVIAH